MKTSTRKRLWIAAVLVALYTIVGFFVLPPIVRSQLEKRASAELGRRVTVEKVHLNPFTLAVTLDGLSVREPDGKTPFVGWRRLYVNFGALGSLWGEWVLSEIALDGFSGRVAIDQHGAFNFGDILAKLQSRPQSPTAEQPGRPIHVAQLRVTEARLEFTDGSRSRPFATTFGPVTFALSGFRTVSRQGAPYAFEAITESGEKFAWSGALQAEPLRSAGDFSVQNIQLPKYSPYYADRMQADVLDGKLSLTGRYAIDLTPGARVLTLSEGSVQLRGFRVRQRGTDTDTVELPTLDVTGIQADAVAQKAAVGSVKLADGHVRIRREKDGALNLLAMLQPPAIAARGGIPPAAAPANPAGAPALPDVNVGEVAVRNLQIDVTDVAAARPAQLSLAHAQLALQNVTLKEGATFPVQLAFDWAPRGTVRLDGAIGLRPLKATLKSEVAAVEILPLSPYLEQFMNARITQGAVNASLAVEASLPAGQPPLATVSGTFSLDEFGLVDGVHNQDLAGFTSLALHGIQVSTSPALNVAVEAIDLRQPHASVVVNADKTLNLALVTATAKPASAVPPTPAAPSSGPAAPPPVIAIGKITILDAEARFTDRSVEPNVGLSVTKFGGTITGLSSTNPAKADVDLKAAVDGSGPVAITGKLDPLGATPSVNLVVDVKNVDLVPLSPYTGKYAGYELARGKLLADLKLGIDGKKLNSSNVVTLHQFTFGQAVQSPDATHLPVRLGVALLKDLNGNIDINLPVQGSLDDPSFHIAGMVWQVVLNLLTKAAVSPFSLLGAAFGGGGEELGYQEFAPGSAVLQPSERPKLDTMVKALTNRPGLSVDLEGCYDPAADTYALKRVKFQDSVRRAIWEKHHLADPNTPPPDQLTIAPEETAAMIKELYDAKFPAGTQFAGPASSAPKVTAAPLPPPPKGFFRRAAALVTLKHLRQKRAAERDARRIAAEEQKVSAAAAAMPELPIEEMTSRLADAQAVDANDLRGLAQARAQAVRDYFATNGKIAGDRLFLAKPETDPAKASKGPRVFLHLQ
jgi:hypothetical protein